MSTTAALNAPSSPPTIIPTASYEEDIAELTTSPDTDLTVYTKLITTADFDSTGRFPVGGYTCISFSKLL